MSRNPFSVTIVATVVAFCLLSCDAAQAKKPINPGGGGGGRDGTTYDIIPFAPFDFTGSSARVSGLNETGTAAIGHAELPSGETRAAFLDIATQSYTTFPVGVSLSDINNLNQMVGSIGDDPNTAAFWDDLSADPVTLPPLDGHTISWASSINDAGIIVGASLAPDYGSYTGAVWRVTRDDQNVIVVDGPLPLPTLPGDLAAGGDKINELRDGMAQAVGESNSDTSREAVVWTIEIDADGQLVAPAIPQGLGTLNIRDPSYSSGYSINIDGDAVGYSDQHPFFVAAGGVMEQLPETSKTVSGGTARDINDSGAIVGSLEIEEDVWSRQLGIPHAILWQDGEIVDLAKVVGRKSGWTRLWYATQISNNGVIAGYGNFDDERGFLMIPNTSSAASIASVPEPSTLALLAIATIAVLPLRRKNRTYN